MKKKRLLAAVILIVILAVAALFIRTANRVEEFSVLDYEDCIIQFPSELVADPVNTPWEAKHLAQEIWEDTYDTGSLSYRPYAVFYDSENYVWMVRGNIPEAMLGGVPYILVKEDGNVLAVWHTR